MTLAENVTLTGGFGDTYTVGKYIAQGGQGSVHLVHKANGECLVVKWYFEHQATPAQRAAIQMLVNSGPPKGKFQDSFVWPLDIVTAEGSQLFGYVMPLIDKVRFASLNDVFSKRRREPSLAPMCRITFLAAGCYRALHASGQCYRDISPGNLLFDPASGEVRICDNDNVGPDETTTAQIRGTWEYMAPEVATRAANPSTRTDLHSLAVLLFKLWMWHHPLHGLLEERIRSLDDDAYRLLYGEIPVFIFDPNDQSNAPPPGPDYDSVRRRWALCPTELQALFLRAFTEGLHDPARRVREGEWQRAARIAQDNFFTCQHCGAENAMASGNGAGRCWHCQRPVPSLPWLQFRTPAGGQWALLKPGFTLQPRHLSGDQEEEDKVLGELSQHPANPLIWGLKNTGNGSWRAVFPDGSSADIVPQRSVPLNDGTEILFNPTATNGTRATILVR